MIEKDIYIYNQAREAINVIDSHWKPPSTTAEQNVRRSLELIADVIENHQTSADFFSSVIKKIDNIRGFNKTAKYDIDNQLNAILYMSKAALYDALEEKILLEEAELIKEKVSLELIQQQAPEKTAFFKALDKLAKPALLIAGAGYVAFATVTTVKFVRHHNTEKHKHDVPVEQHEKNWAERKALQDKDAQDKGSSRE